MTRAHRIVTGSLRANCYVVSYPAGGAVVIDPGDDAEAIAAHLSNRELNVHAVLVTHAHDDHLAAAAAIAVRERAPVHLHSADSRTLERANFIRIATRNERPIRIPTIDVDLAGCSELCFGALRVSVLHTPGHTPGGTCFLIGEDLFTGDTVLDGRLGRTDLPGGDRLALESSIRRIARACPRQATIWPGHGGAFGAHDFLDNYLPVPEHR